MLEGILDWGKKGWGPAKLGDLGARSLRGTYVVRWQEYANLDGDGPGRLRFLAVAAGSRLRSRADRATGQGQTANGAPPFTRT